MHASSAKKGDSKLYTSGSIPIFMRVSHMWVSMTGKRNGKEGLDSVSSVEEWGRNGKAGQHETKVERVMGVKVPEIYVRRDVDVESAFSEG